MFEGRGVVILAGRLQYMVPAWINVHMLRRTGDRALAGCCWRLPLTFCCIQDVCPHRPH
jgi:hypothetical protein